VLLGENAVETISIRDIRGADLLERARRGQTVAITNRGALIGVAIPVAAAWLDHLIDYNLSRVQQGIAEGEQAMTARAPMTTLDDVTREAGTTAVRLHAAVVSGAVTQTPESEELLRRIHEGFHPPGAATQDQSGPAEPSVRTVRIGDLGGRVIDEAGDAGQTLAVTHDRELVTIVVPVTKGLVEFLIEQNMSRVLGNIKLSENRVAAPGAMTSLDRALEMAESLDRAIDQAASPGREEPAGQQADPEATRRAPQ
jgi:antitoxin (DNA-binding transcriptional repressor) of toxin-antitoxin stability system